jgi:hypothetical protein
MYDILMILIFWAMVLAPCMVAMNVGLHLHSEDNAEDFIADGSEFEPSPFESLLPPPQRPGALVRRRPAARLAVREDDSTPPPR